nr:phage tail tape measure protein [Lacticaseibacillus suilingensis]
MAGNIKGITIEINGDTTKLDKALSDVNKQTTNVNKELRQVDNLLKFNPGNTELVAQKQKLLAKQVEQTSSKLKTLKEAQSQVEAQFKAGDIGEDQYRAFQREVVATEGKLDHFSGQLKNTDAYLKDNNDAAGMAAVGYSKAAVKASQAGQDIQDMGDKADDTGGKLDQIASNTFSEKLQNIGDAFSDIGGKVQEFGETAIDAWSEMDNSVDNLTSKTGATGAVAEQLGASFEKVEGSMAGSQMESEDLSNTMAGLHSVFGLTGKQLESTTEYVAQFSAVTGQSGTDAVDALRETLGKFNVQAKDIPGVLDAFTAASQSSGVSVDDLESSVAAAYPVFSQLHISLKDGVGVVAQWAKGGVDASTALKGMQKASATYAASNKTLQQGLTGTFNAIKNAKNPVDALNAGVAAFGTRQAPAMVAAIQNGKVNLDDLTKSATDAGGTVKSSFDQTLDPIDKATQAQKQMKQSLAEIGGEILTTVAPVLKQVADFAKKMAEGFGKLPGPVKQFIIAFGGMAVVLGMIAPIIAAFVTMGGIASAVAAGIAAAIAIVIVVIQNWGSIVTWLKGIWNGLVTFFSNMWNGIKTTFTNAMNAIVAFLTPVWNGIKSFITVVITAIALVIGTAWHLIHTTITTVMNAIKSVITSIWNAIKGFVMPVVNAIKTGITTAWNGIKKVTSTVFNAVKSVITSIWNGIKSFVTGAVNGIKRVVTGVWNGIKSATSTVWNGIKNAIMTPINAAKNAVSKAINAIKGFFNFKISWPHIPMPHFGISPAGWKIGDLLKGKLPHLSINWHAAGGIFNKPTLFAGGDGSVHGVGEAGAEAVAPISKLMDYVQAAVSNTMGAATAQQLVYMKEQNDMLTELVEAVVEGVPAYVDWKAGARTMQPEIQRLTNSATRTKNRRLGNA